MKKAVELEPEKENGWGLKRRSIPRLPHSLSMSTNGRRDSMAVMGLAGTTQHQDMMKRLITNLKTFAEVRVRSSLEI